MLRFHHDLGLLLHYHRVPSLRHNVITNVPWVVTVTSALLHPLTTDLQDYEPQFKLLHDHGILLESLAIHIWSVRCPEEAAHLSSPEQRSFLFRLYESFSMLYDTGKMMVPPGGHTPSRAWLCPPLVRKLGDAATSRDGTSKFDESSHLYLICKKGGHFPSNPVLATRCRVPLLFSRKRLDAVSASCGGHPNAVAVPPLSPSSV